MPSCPLHIIALAPGVSLSAFLTILNLNGVKPILQAKVIRWVVLPTNLSSSSLLALNNHWDLLLILEAGVTLPIEASNLISASWSLNSGIPSALLKDYGSSNSGKSSHQAATTTTIPKAQFPAPANAESAQTLALSPELSRWIRSLPHAQRSHPVAMLNLLAFHPDAKQTYKRYGEAFAQGDGSRHGGKARLVGNVVGGRGMAEGWHELAVAWYPSWAHFAGMLASEDYQTINHRWRLPSLKDTLILATQEIDSQGSLLASSTIKPSSKI